MFDITVFYYILKFIKSRQWCNGLNFKGDNMSDSNWSWKKEDQLMVILIDIQNSNKYINRDLLTIVGFFKSRKELVDHINRHGGDVK